MSYPNQRTSFVKEPICFNVKPTKYPIVIDTGASISVSPHQDDFVDGISTSIIQDLKGLDHSTKVQGMGMVEWTVYDLHTFIREIWTIAFYVLDATIRLFSPQAYFLEGSGRGHLHCDKDRSLLLQNKDNPLEFPCDAISNLPFMLPITKMNLAHGSSPTPSHSIVELTNKNNILFSQPETLMGLMTVADEVNQNLTTTQKELL
jgi:hypothetical protein